MSSQSPHPLESLPAQPLPAQPLPPKLPLSTETPQPVTPEFLMTRPTVTDARGVGSSVTEPITRSPAAPIIHRPDQSTIVAKHGPVAEPVALPASVSQPPSPQQIAHRQLEQRTMQDVLLLLEAMFTREDSTVRLILDRLYDIGSVNLVNQRVSNQWLNQIARWVARCSRPVARLLIMRWFKRNCPRLISNWLYSQVKFEPKQLVQAAAQVDSINPPSPQAAQGAAIPEVENYRRQVHQLNLRVRTLTILLIGVTFTLGGSLAWAVWQQSAWRTRSQPISNTRPAALLHPTPSNPQPPN